MHPSPILRAVALCLACVAGSLHAADEWTDISAETDKNLPGNEIQYLANAADGGVWVGTLTGVAHYRDGVFTPIMDRNPKRAGEIAKLRTWCVYELGPGDFMVGHGGGLLHVQGETQTEALTGFSVAPIVAVQEGLIWAIAKDGRTERNYLYQYVDGAWSEVDGAKGLIVVDIFKDDDGVIWITLDGNGVIAYNPAGTLSIKDSPHHLQGLNISEIDQCGNQVWAGLWSRGVASWDGEVWTHYLKKEKESTFTTFTRDIVNNTWVASTASGIWSKKMSNEEWQNYLADEGAISLLFASSDGRVYVSSQAQGGLRYWDGKAFVTSLDSPLPIQTILERPNGEIWAGGVLDGLHILKKK